MSRIDKLNKKAMGWPYVVGLIIGLILLLALLFIIFKGKNELFSISDIIGNMFS